MSDDKIHEYDDLGEALREGRTLRPAKAYRIRYAQGDLNFHTIEIADPVPLGRQILVSGGAKPLEGFSLFAILPTGDFEDVRLDEPFDLRARGAERFIAFLTDRDYKFTINNRQLVWGKPTIRGTDLYTLAEVGEDEAVFLEVRGGEDKLIKSNESVDLAIPGVERFITAPRPSPECEIVVNGRPRVVPDKKVTFEQVVQLAFPNGQPQPNSVFSMTYRHAASHPP